MNVEHYDPTAVVDEPKTMKAIAPDKDLPINDDKSRDHAGAKGWSIGALEAMLSSIDHQPNFWRDEADLWWGYIDGKQFTPRQEAALRAEGLTDLKPTNLIGRTIRSIAGQEAKSRSGVKVEADDDEVQDVCEVMNQGLVEARREAKVDMAVSGAYFSQLAIGIGWVKVDRDPDPLNYPHRCRFIDRRYVWWDWQAKDPMLRDARWLVHMEWADLDELLATMPKHRETLKLAATGWMGWGNTMSSFEPQEAIQVSSFEDYRNFGRTRRRDEWFDETRHQIKLYEVWYRVPAQAIVLQLGPTKRVLFDETNQSHINAVVSGQCRIFKTITSQVRCALYAGPHRLQDYGTRKRTFPFVPFFAYRDDQDMTPYGLVAGMIGPQDEYNARRLRINWLLRARQIIMDSDALDKKANTLAQIVDAIMRPDLTVVLDPTRKNANAFRVESNLSMQKEQFDVMQDAKQLMQDVPGWYGSNLGNAPSGVTSGIANSVLIEQGQVSMGDLNDNYRDSKTLVHELMLEQIVEDHSMSGMVVKIGRGSARRQVVLNVSDEQGNIVNGVYDATLRVGLGEAPNSPAYRLVQQQQLATLVQALAQSSPQAAAVLAPAFVEATDLPDRQERADDVRKALGIPTAGDKQAAKEAEARMQQEQEQAKAMAQQAATLELQGKQADIGKTLADTEKAKAETELTNAKVHRIGFDEALDAEQAGQAAVQPATEAANDPNADRLNSIRDAIGEARANPGYA